jgi:hypothetical protein
MVGRRISRQRKKPRGHWPTFLKPLAMLETLEENFLGQFLDHTGFPLETPVQEGEQGSFEAGHEMGQGFLLAGLELGHPEFWRFALGRQGKSRAHAFGPRGRRESEKAG